MCDHIDVAYTRDIGVHIYVSITARKKQNFVFCLFCFFFFKFGTTDRAAQCLITTSMPVGYLVCAAGKTKTRKNDTSRMGLQQIGNFRLQLLPGGQVLHCLFSRSSCRFANPVVASCGTSYYLITFTHKYIVI